MLCCAMVNLRKQKNTYMTLHHENQDCTFQNPSCQGKGRFSVAMNSAPLQESTLPGRHLSSLALWARDAKFCYGRCILGRLHRLYKVTILTMLALCSLCCSREKQATSGKSTKRIKKGFLIGLGRPKAPFQRVPYLQSGRESPIPILQQYKMHTGAMTPPSTRPLSIPRYHVGPHGAATGNAQVPNSNASAPRASLCRAPIACLWGSVKQDQPTRSPT